MGLETGDWIDDLVPTNPLGTDPKSEGDDHLRLIKKVLQDTLINAGKAFDLNVMEADIAALTAGSIQFIETIEADDATQIDFTDLDDTYGEYQIICTNWQGDSPTRTPMIQTSSNNGISFDTVVGDYGYGFVSLKNGTAQAIFNDDALAIFVNDTGSTRDGVKVGCSGTITIVRPSDPAQTQILFNMIQSVVDNVPETSNGGGVRLSNLPVDAVRISSSAAAPFSGKFSLYGVVTE